VHTGANGNIGYTGPLVSSIMGAVGVVKTTLRVIFATGPFDPAEAFSGCGGGLPGEAVKRRGTRSRRGRAAARGEQAWRVPDSLAGRCDSGCRLSPGTW